MPKGSKELTEGRVEEIISSTLSLYETMGFKAISLKDIAEKTSFTRPSIYNYFHSKEEIFLVILKKEYDIWNEDLYSLLEDHESLEKEEFVSLFAETLSKRERLLKIMSMNHYDLEENCRIEKLIEFKKSYKVTFDRVRALLYKYFSSFNKEEVEAFIYAFFPFMFGIYPYAVVTDKQKIALEESGNNYAYMSIKELIENELRLLLK